MTLLEQELEIDEALFFIQEIVNNKDVAAFIPYINPSYKAPDHLHLLCKELAEITFEGAKKNLCLSAPPQHFKTTTLQHWVALHLKINPTANIVYMSYNVELAMERVYEITNIMTKMGILPDPKQSTKKQYWTQDGGKITAAGIDVGFTGRKADIIIIDDPHKKLDDVMSIARMKTLINVFTGVVETREQNKTSVILTHTRWAKGDLIGWVLENRKRYVSINIPVITDGGPLLPEVFDLEQIAQRQIENPDGFQSNYMGQPPNSMGSLFHSEVNNKPLPKYYKETPNEYDNFAIGGDLAYTDKTRADYSVLIYMYSKDSKYYIDNVERWQKDFNYTREKLKQAQIGNDVPIQLEFNGVQKAIVDTLTNDGIIINPQSVNGSKYTRALEFSAQWNLGNVYLKKADWNEWFIKEILSFTGSGLEHDDLIDGCVYAFRGLTTGFAFA